MGAYVSLAYGIICYRYNMYKYSNEKTDLRHTIVYPPTNPPSFKKKEEKTTITEFIKNMKDASRDDIFIWFQT